MLGEENPDGDGWCQEAEETESASDRIREGGVGGSEAREDGWSASAAAAAAAGRVRMRMRLVWCCGIGGCGRCRRIS